MKPKDFLIPAVIFVILTALSGLVRGFPLRFLEPILTIQMVGAPAPFFPFRIIFTSLLIDLVFWFLLTFAAWWGFKFWSRMVLILVLGFFVVLGVAIFWQYNLHQTLSQTDMACGGDWSYAVKCPLGSSCQSLGQGPLAGGICKPWLSSVFEVAKPTPTPTPTPPSGDETKGWRTYSKIEYGFSIEYPPSWVIRGENIPQLYAKERGSYPVAKGEVGLRQKDDDSATIEVTIADLSNPDNKSYFEEGLDTALRREKVKLGNSNFEKFVGVNLQIAPDAYRRLDFWTLKSENQKLAAKIQVGSRITGSAVNEDVLKNILSTFKFLD